MESHTYNYKQRNLRFLMKEHKTKLQKQKSEHEKIVSPLAKYDNLGKLNCIICKSVIRSETVWKVHINTKTHKKNFEFAKKLKDRLLGSPISQTGNKYTEYSLNNASQSLLDNFSQISGKELPYLKKPISILPDESLPEGFFDDPIKDAKARNTEFRDPQDEEWDRFKREIKEQTYFSTVIIAGELDEATVDRQIEEIDEQMEKWLKVINLEKQKELVIKQKQEDIVLVSQEIVSSDDSNTFDEFSDWRSKTCFKK